MPKRRARSSRPKSRRILAEASSEPKCRILIIGVGGAGNQTVDRLLESGLVGADCIAVNTDLKDLSSITGSRRVLIGEKAARGLSAHGNPVIGRAAAEESRIYIENLVAGADVVFVVAGLGGGTGTGATPSIAEIARQKGAVTVGVVSMPLSAEKGRTEPAARALNEIRSKCDTVIVVDENRILRLAPELETSATFRMTNQVLANIIRGIVENVSRDSLINMRFADFRTVVQKGGIAAVGVGESRASNRAEEAVRNALKTPLLDVSWSGAKGALVDVRGDSNMTIEEVNRVGEIVTKTIGHNAPISCGARINNGIESGLKVTIVMTGMDSPKMVSMFGNMIPELYDIESSFTEPKDSLPIELALDQIENLEG